MGPVTQRSLDGRKGDEWWFQRSEAGCRRCLRKFETVRKWWWWRGFHPRLLYKPGRLWARRGHAEGTHRHKRLCEGVHGRIRGWMGGQKNISCRN